MDEIKSDYFVPGDQAAAYHYAVERPDLKDTPGIRRDLANLFKPVFMPEQTRIDFDKWLTLEKQGYCYSGSSANGGAAMAMDFTTKEGFIIGVVVGSTSSCRGKKVGRGLGNDSPPGKSDRKGGGGC